MFKPLPKHGLLVMFKHLQVEMRTFSDFDKLYKYVNILPDVPPLPSNQHICLKKLPEFPALPALIFHTEVRSGVFLFFVGSDILWCRLGVYVPTGHALYV